MALLIRNADCVTADRRWRGDVRVAGGTVVELGEGLEETSGEEVIDAGDQLLLPGGVDPHVHLQLPVAGTVSADDFASGTAAGLAGGTTTIIDFVHPERGQDMVDALRSRQAEAAGAVADYGFHMAVTWWGEDSEQQMQGCIAAGVPSFKCYLAYQATVGLDDRDFVRAVAAAGRLGALVLVHAEHGPMADHLAGELFAAGHTGPSAHPRSRPPDVEGEATERAAMIARLSGAPLYVVHVTCRPAVEALRRAQQLGQPIWAETCPHYLLLDDSVYEQPDFAGAAYVVSPPIRSKEHQPVLWQALREGVLQVVATDHCPFNQEQKELGREDFRRIPGGAAGIEHRLSLLYTYGVGNDRIDLRRFVDLVSTRPAKLFGLYPRKGSIAVGADADLVLWDPAASATISANTHHHRCDRSIFSGMAVRGLPSTVIANGEVRYRDGALLAEPGAGRFLQRSLLAGSPPTD